MKTHASSWPSGKKSGVTNSWVRGHCPTLGTVSLCHSRKGCGSSFQSAPGPAIAGEAKYCWRP